MTLVQASSPIIVKIVEPSKDPTGLAAVVFGALGLTGVIVLLALLVGLVFAGVLFWFRSKKGMGKSHPFLTG